MGNGDLERTSQGRGESKGVSKDKLKLASHGKGGWKAFQAEGSARGKEKTKQNKMPAWYVLETKALLAFTRKSNRVR